MSTGQVEMSSSYSGGSVKNENTLFSSALPEAYTTLNDAQKDHAQYQSHQVTNTTGSVSTTSTNPSGGSQYTYDCIPSEGNVKTGVVGEREEGGSGGGLVKGGSVNPPGSLRRYEARNILYEDNELPVETIHHRGVHASSYNTYSGAKPKDSYITCRCKTRTLIITFFIVMAILLAVAALVLTIMLWFGVHSESSSSPSSSPPPECSCPDQGAAEELRSSLELLRHRFETLKNNSGIREELYADLSQVQNDIMVLTNIAEEVSQPVNHTVIVSGFNIYEECTTHTETCTISDVPASATQHPCLTVEAYVDIPGQFLLKAYCSVTGDGVPVNNTVVATLEELTDQGGNELMRCRCSKLITSVAETQPTGDNVCTLTVTRCPATRNINATLTRLT